jgi:hypothetical protein
MLLLRQPKSTIEIIYLPRLDEAFGLEPLEVGQIAKSGEAERLQESLRRHISKGCAWLRRADGAVDEPMALEGGDDVAADLPPG